ncbi:MAG: adenosylcobalamin-dependent ribonucleoside-diphosphate reductase [Candidatus Pacearchaeota archaeon]|nr:adenosylcobalamin-dependent ribonucleoside-diphosphate reductase [Candidatus Pacearchaeota archaeon]
MKKEEGDIKRRVATKQITFIKKRDGSVVSFNPIKIENAILKAMKAIDLENKKFAKALTTQVINELNKNIHKFEKGIPNVEEIQDIVEQVLEKNNERLFKVYSLYRRSRHLAREIRKFFKIKDDMKFSANALKVLEERYLLKDETGKIIETPSQMFQRIAKAVASIDKIYHDDIRKSEQEFLEIMTNLEFLPNSPTIMNAGTNLGQLSACFVLPIEDNLESIFTTLKHMAIIQQSGGGTGFSFSKLRPKGDMVKSTKGIASGPVSFIKIYDTATDVIKQGGKRRGANMAILHCTHPDIEEFITAKQKEKQLSNFNISVAITDSFMKAVLKNKNFNLINPRTNKIVKKINAKNLFDEICRAAWQTGDPGLVFIDEINRKQPTPEIGTIETTNPCGEVPLLAYESCNLGSINLSKFVSKGTINWERLRKVVHVAVHFLDNVIDANKYPLPEIEKMTKANRKIGLGVMGFADLLIKLRIPYKSNEALRLGEKIMSFISKEARNASVALAKSRGSFPNFEKSIYKNKFPCLRNATLTTIAPTGSISIIAGCSSGIEPLFAIAYVREIMEGKRLIEINQDFKIEAIKKGFFTDDLIKKIARTGSVQKTSLPSDIKKVYVTALEIPVEWHVKMQAAFQKYTDNAVSKTVNLPEHAKPEEIKKIFMLAWRLKCKGITVYRYGSKPEQVLYLGKGKKLTKAELHYSGGSACTECSL